LKKLFLTVVTAVLCSGYAEAQPLQVSAAYPGGVVNFVQVTDLHVNDAESAADTARVLAAIEKLDPRPDFVFSTGDNVITGSDAGEVSSYLAAISTLTVPYFTASGNHDFEDSGAPAAAMAKETYFSFDAGPAHFSVVNCFGKDEAQARWFQEDIEAAARNGKKTVVFSHNILGRDWDGPVSGKLREIAVSHKDDILAVFAGHWHADRVFVDEGVKTIVTPPLAFGGLDCSPAGFRAVNVSSAGVLSWEYVPAWTRTMATATSYDAAGGGSSRLIARFMDSTQRAEAAEIQGGRTRIKLNRVNRYAFEASLPPGSLPDGGQVVFTDKAGRTIFRIPLGKPSPAAKVEPGGPWNTFHHDSGRTGATGDSPGPDLRVAWAADTGGMPFSNSPVYYEGRVYTAARSWSSEAKPYVSAFDAVSGALLWRTELPSDVIHTPTVTDGMLSVLTVNAELLLLDPLDGKILAVQRPGAPLNRLHTPGATAADAAGRHVGGARSHVAAVEAGGGTAILYSLGADLDDWAATLQSPALYDGHAVFATLWGYGMWSLDLAGGTAEMINKIQENYGSSPVTDGKTLYVAGDSKLQALDLATGKVLWSLPGFQYVAATPALDSTEGALYAIGEFGHLLKVRAADGEILWDLSFAKTSKLNALPYRSGGKPAASSPAVSARCVWAVDLMSGVYCISKDGKVLGSFALGSPALSSPAVSGNTVFINAMDGFLYALVGEEKKDGAIARRAASQRPQAAGKPSSQAPKRSASFIDGAPEAAAR